MNGTLTIGLTTDYETGVVELTKMIMLLSQEIGANSIAKTKKNY